MSIPSLPYSPAPFSDGGKNEKRILADIDVELDKEHPERTKKGIRASDSWCTGWWGRSIAYQDETTGQTKYLNRNSVIKYINANKEFATGEFKDKAVGFGEGFWDGSSLIRRIKNIAAERQALNKAVKEHAAEPHKPAPLPPVTYIPSSPEAAPPVADLKIQAAKEPEAPIWSPLLSQAIAMKDLFDKRTEKKFTFTMDKKEFVAWEEQTPYGFMISIQPKEDYDIPGAFARGVYKQAPWRKVSICVNNDKTIKDLQYEDSSFLDNTQETYQHAFKAGYLEKKLKHVFSLSTPLYEHALKTLQDQVQPPEAAQLHAAPAPADAVVQPAGPVGPDLKIQAANQPEAINWRPLLTQAIAMKDLFDKRTEKKFNFTMDEKEFVAWEEQTPYGYMISIQPKHLYEHAREFAVLEKVSICVNNDKTIKDIQHQDISLLDTSNESYQEILKSGSIIGRLKLFFACSSPLQYELALKKLQELDRPPEPTPLQAPQPPVGQQPVQNAGQALPQAVDATGKQAKAEKALINDHLTGTKMSVAILSNTLKDKFIINPKPIKVNMSGGIIYICWYEKTQDGHRISIQREANYLKKSMDDLSVINLKDDGTVIDMPMDAQIESQDLTRVLIYATVYPPVFV